MGKNVIRLWYSTRQYHVADTLARRRPQNLGTGDMFPKQRETWASSLRNRAYPIALNLRFTRQRVR